MRFRVPVRGLAIIGAMALAIYFFWDVLLTIALVLLVLLVILIIARLFLPFGLGRHITGPIFRLMGWSFSKIGRGLASLLAWGFGIKMNRGVARRQQQEPLIVETEGEAPALDPKGGILIVGSYYDAVRSLVADLVRQGRRVVIVGHVSLCPSGLRSEEVRVIPLWKARFNALRLPDGGVERRSECEKLALALTVAGGLDASEVGMIARFLDVATRSGGVLTEEDLERLRTDYGAHAARLKDPLSLLIDHFNHPYPSLQELIDFRSGWKVCVLDDTRLPESSKLFARIYAIMNLERIAPGAVVVISGIEFVLPDINVLPYDARLVWLRLYRHLESLSSTGLVLATSNPYAAPQLMDVSSRVLLIDPPLSLLAYLRRNLGVTLNMRGEEGQYLIYRDAEGWKATRVIVGITGPIPVPAAQSSALMVVEAVRSRVTAAYRDTVLFADFADHAEDAYRALRAVRYLKEPDEHQVASEARVSVELVRRLAEKGYITRTEMRLVLTQLGESALEDFDSKVRGRRPQRFQVQQGGRPGPDNKTPQPEPAVPPEADEERRTGKPVQTDLKLFSGQILSPSELGEYYRDLSDARAAIGRGNHMMAVKVAFRGLHGLLKRIAGAEKGTIPELASMVREKGILIEESEAKRAVAAIARVGRVQKQVEQGVQVSQDLEKQIAEDAVFLADLLERVLMAAEGAAVSGAEPDEEDEGQDLDGDGGEEA